MLFPVSFRPLAPNFHKIIGSYKNQSGIKLRLCFPRGQESSLMTLKLKYVIEGHYELNDRNGVLSGTWVLHDPALARAFPWDKGK